MRLNWLALHFSGPLHCIMFSISISSNTTMQFYQHFFGMPFLEDQVNKSCSEKEGKRRVTFWGTVKFCPKFWSFNHCICEYFNFSLHHQNIKKRKAFLHLDLWVLVYVTAFILVLSLLLLGSLFLGTFCHVQRNYAQFIRIKQMLQIAHITESWSQWTVRLSITTLPKGHDVFLLAKSSAKCSGVHACCSPK